MTKAQKKQETERKADEAKAEAKRRAYRGAIRALIEYELRVAACRAIATFPNLSADAFVNSARCAFTDAVHEADKRTA